MPAVAITAPDNDVDGLRDDVRRAIGQGHRRFKIKIGGASLASDIERIEAVFGLLERGMSLAVDGNGTFDRGKTIQYLDALKPYPLAWIEEPVHPLDFELASRHRGANVRLRWRPARTCSRATMRAIFFATLVCGRIVTSCNSTFR